MGSLIEAVNKLVGDVNYLPYSMADTFMTVGAPPVTVKGLQYVFANRMNRSVGMRMSLNAKGIYLDNQNKSGIVEFAVLSNTVTTGAMELMNLTGIAGPIFITDKSTKGTSTVLGTKAKLIQTPEWRRSKFPNLQIFTYHVASLNISHGVRFAE